MPNIFTRIFAYPILERELLNRLADRDTQIVSLKIENQDLKDRLYMKHGFVPSGQSIDIGKPAHVPPYRTGRQRLREMVMPPVAATLTEAEQRIIEESVTQ